ncbi:MAG: hypothetical protein M3O70_01585 [Actinomycetota bacterium]|nr:hypothetical protein [Actinomycetota bacterium]
MLPSIRKTRRGLYRWARILGDISAIGSGDSRRMGKRLFNKVLGRQVVRRAWWR